jgi:RimJ/RimL family protein N-acetyltransferase
MELRFDGYMIRSWQASDAEALVRHANNPKVAANLRDVFPSPYTPKDAAQWVAFASNQNPETNFAIATDEEPIGGIGITLGSDIYRMGAEVGYWLGEAYWGRGIVSRALGVLVDWAFETFDLNRIWADPFATNPASAKVLERNGFQLEAIKRASVIKGGRVLDQMLYARLRPGLREEGEQTGCPGCAQRNGPEKAGEANTSEEA